MVARIALVSCVKTKAERACQAEDLYTSAWFTKARSLIERSGLKWFILSAEHGLVDPKTVITPYEKALNRMGVAERKAWGERVIAQLATSLPPKRMRSPCWRGSVTATAYCLTSKAGFQKSPSPWKG